MIALDRIEPRRIVAATVALFAVLFCALAPRPALATTARWMELGPPLVGSGPALYDSNRHRGLVLTTDAIWAVSGDPVPSWSKIWTGVSLPPITSASILGVVYDPVRDRIWAFTTSSHGTGLNYYGQLWTMDLGVPPLTWVERSFSNTAPFLGVYAYAFDPARDRIVLFGGNALNCPGCETNAVNILSLSGTPTWSAPTVQGSWYVGTAPGARMQSTGVYDPIRDRMLFFGGVHYTTGPFTQTIYNETWALSLGDSMSWSFLTPTTAVATARYSAFGGYDPAGERMIVTGGSDAGTWTLDLSLSAPADSAVWTQIDHTTYCNGRSWMDPLNSRLLQYCGIGPGSEDVSLWSLSLGASPAWSKLTPGQRPASGNVYFGFSNVSGQQWYLQGLWQRPNDPEPTATWQPTGASLPAIPPYGQGVARDSAGARELVFGGGSSDPTQSGTEYSELCAFDFGGSGWSTLAPIGAPTPRADALTLFDTNRRQLVIHGGRYSSPSKPRTRTDTWMYDAATNTWATLAAGSFGGRWGEVGIYDRLRDRLVAFGGSDSMGTYPDVHVLPLGGGGVWAPLATTGTPPPDYYAHAGYDAAGDRMIVLDNDNSGSMVVYALSLDNNPTWSQVAVDGVAPEWRKNYACATDETGGRMLVTDGVTLGYAGGTALDDDWLLVFDEATPVLLSLVRSDASADRVRIVWQAEGLSSTSFTAYRRTPGGGWSAVASLVPDGSGFLTLEDRAVSPGARYEYRLGAMNAGSERYYGEVSVTVPRTSALRLDGARPNPASGDVRLSFALGSNAPATLDLVDVAGRRVLERAVGALGPGEHVLRIAEAGWLPAGVYVARLTQAGERRIAKLAVVR